MLGHDGIHGFCFNKFTSIHDRLALKINRCLQGTHVPEWMTKGKTTVIQKGPSKGTAPNNYKPIICLPMTRKILTAQIREEIYNSQICRELFPEEQKGWCKVSRRTAEFPHIDEHILNESKTRQKGIWYGPARPDNQLPQNEVINFIGKTMKTWRVELTAGGRSLAKVKIQRGISQGDALSPLLFIIAMIPLNHILRKWTAGYKLCRSLEKINHLMYMDDIKLFAKNDRLYVSTKEEGRWLASTEYSVDASIQRLKDYIEKHQGGLITVIKNYTHNTITNRMTITRKQKWKKNPTLWMFKTTNKQHLTRQNLEVAKKRKL